MNPPNSSFSNQSNQQSNKSGGGQGGKPPSNIKDKMVKEIKNLKNLADYPIRELVEHAEDFGPYLKQNRLETNQVRKFLDAVNRLKVKLAQDKNFDSIVTDVILLKPKLAYAAARQVQVKDLSEVIEVAIDRVKNGKDFERLVQLIESIIAYHKAQGGK